jgi:TolB protein
MNISIWRGLRVGGRGVLLALGCLAMLLWCAPPQAAAPQNSIGDFEGRTNVGSDLKPGSVSYDAASHKYTVSGSGGDIWGPDAFYFVWKKLDSDVTLTADAAIVGDDGQEYRKAGFMIREGLGPNDRYVDVVIHGDGLAALQWRSEPGGPTQEFRAAASSPQSIRLERKGNTFRMYLAGADHQFYPVGSTDLDLHAPLYVGLAVCAHDSNQLQTATFSNFRIETNR